jgi:hypothetical protein
MMRWKATRRSDKRWPQPPMDKRDLTLDQTAHQNIVTVPNRSRHRENLAPFRVSPPAAPHWFPGDGLSNGRDACPASSTTPRYPLDPGDWLNDADRAALHATLAQSQADVDAGRLVDAADMLKRLRSS